MITQYSYSPPFHYSIYPPRVCFIGTLQMYDMPTFFIHVQYCIYCGYFARSVVVNFASSCPVLGRIYVHVFFPLRWLLRLLWLRVVWGPFGWLIWPLFLGWSWDEGVTIRQNSCPMACSLRLPPVVSPFCNNRTDMGNERLFCIFQW